MWIPAGDDFILLKQVLTKNWELLLIFKFIYSVWNKETRKIKKREEWLANDTEIEIISRNNFNIWDKYIELQILYES